MMHEGHEEHKEHKKRELAEREELLANCDPFGDERREAECEKFTEESLVSEEEKEAAEELECDSYDPCRKPEARLWDKVTASIAELRKSKEWDAHEDTLEEIEDYLERAASCDENRDEIAEKLAERFSKLNRDLKRKGGRSDAFNRFFRAIWLVRQSWQSQNSSQLAVENICNLLCLAEKEVTKFKDEEDSAYKDEFFGPEEIRDAMSSTVDELLARIGNQKILTYALLTKIDSCANFDSFAFTKKRILWLQRKIEADCCSILCAFRRIQDSYGYDAADDLVTLLGMAMQYVSQTRALLDALQFDPASPWMEFNDRLNSLPRTIEKLRSEITSIKPALDSCCSQAAQDQISKIEVAAQFLISRSSSLQNSGSASCALIAESRQWTGMIPEAVNRLLCRTDLLRCGVKNSLLDLSGVALQIFCYLGYLQRECDRAASGKGSAAAQPALPANQPGVKVVPALAPGTPGVLLDLPQEIVELFKTRSDANIRIIDANTRNILEIVPADGTTTRLAVAASPGAVIKFEAVASDEVVGTAYATAEV